MTNILIEGWDIYPTGRLNLLSGSPWLVSDNTYSPQVSTTNPITGTRGLRFVNDSSGGSSKVITRTFAPVTELFAGFAIVPNGTPNGNVFRFVFGSVECGITIDSLLRLQFIENGAIRATAATSLGVGVKAYVELHMTLTTYEVFQDGISVMSGNFSSAKTQWDYIRIGRTSTSLGSLNPVIDDIYVNDADGLYNNSNWGETSIITLFPNADTAQADWTPVGVASGYLGLNNVPPDVTKYIETATVGHISTFDVEALPASVYQIFTAWTVFRGQKTEVGAAEVTPSIVQNSVAGVGAAAPVAQNTYDWFFDQFQTDPDTGVSWNPLTFAPQLKFERTA